MRGTSCQHFWTRLGRESIERNHFPLQAIRFCRFRVFLLGRAAAITDNGTPKAASSGENMLIQKGGFEERRPTMTQSSEEQPPPFEIVEPAAWRAPIIFNSPHSGSVYPDEFLKTSRIDLASLRR